MSVSEIQPAAVTHESDRAAILALERWASTDPSLADLTIGEVLARMRARTPVRHLRSVPNRQLGVAAFSSLSQRELDVVRLLAEGLSNKEIGHSLELSDKTIKNHISHILAKLQLTARTQIAVQALRSGVA